MRVFRICSCCFYCFLACLFKVKAQSDNYRTKIAEFSYRVLGDYQTISSSETFGDATSEIEHESLLKIKLGIPLIIKDDKLFGLQLKYYQHYFNFDDEDFEEEPTFDYDSIKKNIEANFPNCGWYHSVWESHKIIPEANLATGDAIDDLTDIIKDFLEVKWCFENTTKKNAEWHFHDLMRIHSEQHLVNFLKYIKDLKG